MRAQDIMTKDPRCVTPQTSVRDAAKLMQEAEVGVLPVVESDGSRKLVGMVTDRDIAIRHVAAGHDSAECPVSEAMSSGVMSCRVDDDVDEVMQKMAREQVRRIPIVDERGDLVGIVAQKDVVENADRREAADTVKEISERGGKHVQ